MGLDNSVRPRNALKQPIGGMHLKQALISWSVFLVVALAYYYSPVHSIWDSAYSLLMDEAILHEGTPNMIAYQVPRGASLGFMNGYPWNIAIVKGRLLYVFPWGLPILSLPGVAIADALGYEIAPNHIYNPGNEIRVQSVFTTVVSAATIYLVYQTASSMLPLSWSLIITLSEAFGTQMWSDVSRSLWAQTWYLLLITTLIFLLMRNWHPAVVLGTLLVWAGFVRPMAGPTLLIIGFYVLCELRSRRARIIYLATMLLWVGVLGTLMLFFLGHLLAPIYNVGLITTRGFLSRLISVLISPGRGLLVYVPVVIAPLYLTARYWQQLRQQRAVIAAVAAISSTIVTLSCCSAWWGGWSYGPRDLVETIPWFSLLAILGVKAFLDDVEQGAFRRRILICAAGLLLTVSIGMNAPGALSWSAQAWNGKPDIDTHPNRLWDWRNPQFLAWRQDISIKRPESADKLTAALEKENAACFGALAIAANKYVDGGFPLADLTPGETQRLGLLTLARGEIPPKGRSSWWKNLWLGGWDGRIGIGIVGNYQDVEFLVRKYEAEATDILFPYPSKLDTRRTGGYGQLLMTFTPEGIRRAANKTIRADAEGLNSRF
jgi:hypothetical protein